MATRTSSLTALLRLPHPFETLVEGGAFCRHSFDSKRPERTILRRVCGKPYRWAPLALVGLVAQEIRCRAGPDELGSKQGTRLGREAGPRALSGRLTAPKQAHGSLREILHEYFISLQPVEVDEALPEEPVATPIGRPRERQSA